MAKTQNKKTNYATTRPQLRKAKAAVITPIFTHLEGSDGLKPMQICQAPNFALETALTSNFI